MALAALGVAQDGAALLAGFGARAVGPNIALRLDHRHWVTLGTVAPVAALTAIVAIATAFALTALFALGARTVVPVAAVAPAVAAALAAFAVAALAVAFAVTVTALPFAAVAAVATVAIVAITIVTVAVTVTVAIVAPLAALAGLGLDLARLVGGFGLGLSAFVLEIDVVARGELIAAEDLGGRALRLQGAQEAEVVFRVLQVVLGENPVTGRAGVAGQLLVLLEDVLGVAPDLHAVGAVRIERAVRVLRLVPAATTAAAIATALALHTLEISHIRNRSALP